MIYPVPCHHRVPYGYETHLLLALPPHTSLLARSIRHGHTNFNNRKFLNWPPRTRHFVCSVYSSIRQIYSFKLICVYYSLCSNETILIQMRGIYQIIHVTKHTIQEKLSVKYAFVTRIKSSFTNVFFQPPSSSSSSSPSKNEILDTLLIELHSFDYPNNIWGRVHTMKLLTMYLKAPERQFDKIICDTI